MDITAQERARGIIFGNQLIAIPQEAGDTIDARHLIQAAQRVIAQRHRLRAAFPYLDQAVFNVIAILPSAAAACGFRGQIAIGVIGKGNIA
jgi:hypothetical protein